ncbi:MAG: hypothetical protein DME45_10815 [Verrucomicrobia bacterium]|nr:MAG: hypothetical protein DME45_10815 [Verrucomicrobiota bacterium]
MTRPTIDRDRVVARYCHCLRCCRLHFARWPCGRHLPYCANVQNLAGETAVCGGSPDCFRVLGSVYSKMAGIPVAAIGTVAYFAVFTFATFAALGYQRARMFLAVTVFMMFLSTLWFLYVQAFLLHAFCRFCLFSAAITFLLTGLVAPHRSVLSLQVPWIFGWFCRIC